MLLMVSWWSPFGKVFKNRKERTNRNGHLQNAEVGLGRAAPGDAHTCSLLEPKITTESSAAPNLLHLQAPSNNQSWKTIYTGWEDSTAIPGLGRFRIRIRKGLLSLLHKYLNETPGLRQLPRGGKGLLDSEISVVNKKQITTADTVYGAMT